jgi:hypothetical protein
LIRRHDSVGLTDFFDHAVLQSDHLVADAPDHLQIMRGKRQDVGFADDLSGRRFAFSMNCKSPALIISSMTRISGSIEVEIAEATPARR